ncbi:MAG: alpha/beta hydrolase-fold protein [Bacteroidales bacterium]|nr:alpha/beta hydrolase-fold protein [Bacteroidales bacterium]
MKYLIALLGIFLGFLVEPQENYSTLTRKALEIMINSKNETNYKKALDMYEEAFSIYPDSIDRKGLYKASILASEIKDYDKAFKYLTPLAAMKTEEDGYPGWSYIVGNHSESEYKNLLSNPRWKVLKQKAIKDKSEFYSELQKKEKEFYSINQINLEGIEDSRILYKKIKNFNPYKTKKNRDYSISFKVNDTTKTSFFIHFPKDYNPKKRYSLLFFLHGAVRSSELSDYQFADWNLGGWNRYYTKYADLNDVILVFPDGSRQYNWMGPDDGFFMIPEMLKLIKKAINIDDNKVFISGHSNGATGSFSYLMKQPTQFAGFYGFNTYPKVFTGGTFVENIKNRSFINFSTDKDYYYPPKANDDFTKLMDGINADYKEYRYNGFPHWFPEFNESEPAYQILFNDLTNRSRKSFPKEISWEFDDEKYGNINWLSCIKLDTLSQKKDWHKELNFKITKWLEFKDRESDDLIEIDVDKNAFDFPRKSGKIKAEYDRNVFRIETSDIKSFSIYISPEMVNLKKKVEVYINGKLYFNKIVNYNCEFMLQNFKNNQDREQIWINSIDLKI